MARSSDHSVILSFHFQEEQQRTTTRFSSPMNLATSCFRSTDWASRDSARERERTDRRFERTAIGPEISEIQAKCHLHQNRKQNRATERAERGRGETSERGREIHFGKGVRSPLRSPDPPPSCRKEEALRPNSTSRRSRRNPSVPSLTSQ